MASGNMLQLNNRTVVCEDCTLAYKAALTLLTVRVKEQNLSDLALLASLMALPCKDGHHPIDQTPLWAVCLPCHARRCLRLLHPLEPSLDWPAWLKRRAQLVFYRASSSDKSVTICDLDPTISLTTVSFDCFAIIINYSLLTFKFVENLKWVTLVDEFRDIPFHCSSFHDCN